MTIRFSRDEILELMFQKAEAIFENLEEEWTELEGYIYQDDNEEFVFEVRPILGEEDEE